MEGQQENIVSPKGVSPSITEQVLSLPIYHQKDELINLIRDNQVVVIQGETGSGKSTQIPQYLVEAGYTKNGKRIAVTQPKRAAAKSLAERVAQETGTELGKFVGYAIRFAESVSDTTVIKYVTDGKLIREAASDHELNQYSVVMIDQAHERSINTDLLCGLVKRICKLRPDFRVIICLASLNEETFSKYFDNAPVFKIPEKSFSEETADQLKELKSFQPSVVPEINWNNVHCIILTIIGLGYENPIEFPFIRKPSEHILREGMNQLTSLNAIDKHGNITEMGKVMSKFPVQPQLAKVLIKSVESGCAPEVLKIAAMLCAQYTNSFAWEKSHCNLETHEKISQFTNNSDGDHLTLLKIYNGWESNGYDENWCKNIFVEPKILLQAKEIRQQLQDILTGNGFEYLENKVADINTSNEKKVKILETFATGFFFQIAKKCGDGDAYKIVSSDPGVANHLVFLHPSGALFSKRPLPELVLFQSILEADKKFICNTSEVQPSMIANVPPDFARTHKLH